MFQWVSSLIGAERFTGPARNAPYGGKGISAYFSQNRVAMVVLTENQISDIRKSLRPTQINAIPPKSNRPPIMCELDGVFAAGHGNYFAQRRLRLQQASAPDPAPESAPEPAPAPEPEPESAPAVPPDQLNDELEEFETLL